MSGNLDNYLKLLFTVKNFYTLNEYFDYKEGQMMNMPTIIILLI